MVEEEEDARLLTASQVPAQALLEEEEDKGQGDNQVFSEEVSCAHLTV